jgi:uncharacterized protein YcfJ
MFLMKRLALTALIGATTLAAIPTEAEARHRHHRNSYYSDRGHDRWNDRREYRHHREKRHYRGCRTSGTTGLIVGGAAGALLGREVDRRGDRATGTILGAAGGALLGREIDRKRRC